MRMPVHVLFHSELGKDQHLSIQFFQQPFLATQSILRHNLLTFRVHWSWELISVRLVSSWSLWNCHKQSPARVFPQLTLWHRESHPTHHSSHGCFLHGLTGGADQGGKSISRKVNFQQAQDNLMASSFLPSNSWSCSACIHSGASISAATFLLSWNWKTLLVYTFFKKKN